MAKPKAVVEQVECFSMPRRIAARDKKIVRSDCNIYGLTEKAIRSLEAAHSRGSAEAEKGWQVGAQCVLVSSGQEATC